MTRTIIGIDPGNYGGITVVNPSSRVIKPFMFHTTSNPANILMRGRDAAQVLVGHCISNVDVVSEGYTNVSNRPGCVNIGSILISIAANLSCEVDNVTPSYAHPNTWKAWWRRQYNKKYKPIKGKEFSPHIVDDIWGHLPWYAEKPLDDDNICDSILVAVWKANELGFEIEASEYMLEDVGVI